ncbi:hypothetical protein SDC9_102264 [bioreactor metagenome]|uniref:Uncharacterized protein n=1 Tax=bioreactor metagenome TaxID=1076179 RepID=A0A645AQY6_9ZZZZ
MKKDFTYSLKKLFKQAETKNTYLMFQKNGELFSADMSEKYIKLHKRHYFIMFITIGPIINVFFDEVSIYLSLILYFLGAIIVFLVGNILRMFIDYFYCRKKFKHGLAKPYIEVSENNFEDEMQATGSFCEHKPSIKFKEFVSGSVINKKVYVCKKCGSSIKKVDKNSYSIKSEMLGLFILLAALELVIFTSINLFKGIKYILQIFTDCTDILIFDEFSFFSILSGLLVAIIIYMMICSYLYFHINYFSKYKKSETVEC